MSYFKVNKMVWDAVPALDKQHITAHLQQYGVLKAGQVIIADIETPPPALCLSINKKADREIENVEALGMDWLCKAICNSIETSNMCSLSDKKLSLCLSKVTASRKEFYKELNTESV